MNTETTEKYCVKKKKSKTVEECFRSTPEISDENKSLIEVKKKKKKKNKSEKREERKNEDSFVETVDSVKEENDVSLGREREKEEKKEKKKKTDKKKQKEKKEDIQQQNKITETDSNTNAILEETHLSENVDPKETERIEMRGRNNRSGERREKSSESENKEREMELEAEMKLTGITKERTDKHKKKSHKRDRESEKEKEKRKEKKKNETIDDNETDIEPNYILKKNDSIINNKIKMEKLYDINDVSTNQDLSKASSKSIGSTEIKIVEHIKEKKKKKKKKHELKDSEFIHNIDLTKDGETERFLIELDELIKTQPIQKIKESQEWVDIVEDHTKKKETTRISKKRDDEIKSTEKKFYENEAQKNEMEITEKYDVFLKEQKTSKSKKNKSMKTNKKVRSDSEKEYEENEKDKSEKLAVVDINPDTEPVVFMEKHLNMKNSKREDSYYAEKNKIKNEEYEESEIDNTSDVTEKICETSKNGKGLLNREKFSSEEELEETNKIEIQGTQTNDEIFTKNSNIIKKVNTDDISVLLNDHIQNLSKKKNKEAFKDISEEMESNKTEEKEEEEEANNVNEMHSKINSCKNNVRRRITVDLSEDSVSNKCENKQQTITLSRHASTTSSLSTSSNKALKESRDHSVRESLESSAENEAEREEDSLFLSRYIKINIKKFEKLLNERHFKLYERESIEDIINYQKSKLEFLDHEINLLMKRNDSKQNEMTQKKSLSDSSEEGNEEIIKNYERFDKIVDNESLRLGDKAHEINTDEQEKCKKTQKKSNMYLDVIKKTDSKQVSQNDEIIRMKESSHVEKNISGSSENSKYENTVKEINDNKKKTSFSKDQAELEITKYESEERHIVEAEKDENKGKTIFEIIYNYYVTDKNKDKPNNINKGMDLELFLNFAKHYKILKGLLTKGELEKVFLNESKSNTHIQDKHFKKILMLCAQMAFTKPPHKVNFTDTKKIQLYLISWLSTNSPDDQKERILKNVTVGESIFSKTTKKNEGITKGSKLMPLMNRQASVYLHDKNKKENNQSSITTPLKINTLTNSSEKHKFSRFNTKI